MPEESFEQLARKMAEQFSMEPQSIVWQRVKAAITPKRRRKAAFIWWLLPLCVACGLGFWLMNDKELVQKKEVGERQNSPAKTNSRATGKMDKANKNAQPYLTVLPTKNNKQSIASADKRDNHFFAQNNQSGNKKKNAEQRIKAMPFQPQTHYMSDKNVAKEKELKPNSNATLLQPQTTVAVNSVKTIDSGKTASQKPQITEVDAAKAQTEVAVKAKDTLKQTKDSSVAIINKKKSKNKWHWGINAEAGTSWLGNGLFGDQAKSLSDFSIVPTGMTNGGSQNSSTYYQQRKNGLDAALGIAVATNLSKRWFLDGALTYRYQQFSIQTISLSTTTNALNGNIIKSNMSYRFQSTNLYTSIGLMFFHKKNSSVALQAGVDNALVLSVKQMHSDSLQTITAQGFRRWLPSLQLSIPVGIYSKRNIRWQLSPFIRWGLRGLQESENTFAHHPFNAAGIKATYFFK